MFYQFILFIILNTYQLTFPSAKPKTMFCCSGGHIKQVTGLYQEKINKVRLLDWRLTSTKLIQLSLAWEDWQHCLLPPSLDGMLLHSRWLPPSRMLVLSKLHSLDKMLVYRRLPSPFLPLHPAAFYQVSWQFTGTQL